MEIGKITEDFEGPAFRLASGGDFYWELVGQQSAFQLAAYSHAVPTLSDSSSVDQALNYVQVVAHASNYIETYPSAVDSARSTDDLAPGAPLNLTAERDPNGEVLLEWSPGSSQDTDIREYAIYRANGADVAIDPANLVLVTPETSVVDALAPVGPEYAYRVVAIDVHENESDASEPALLEGQATGVDPAHSSTLMLRANQPNPFTGNTQIRFELSRQGAYEIEIFDVAGRRIRILRGMGRSGINGILFDGRDRLGNELASGIYHYRVHSGNQLATGKMTVIR